MMIKNSKFTLIFLSVAAFIILAFLLLDLYNIRSKNKETSRLLNIADQAAEEEVLVQSIRTIQNSAKGDLEAFEKAVLSEDKLVPLIESIEGAARLLGVDLEISSVEEAGEATADEPQKLDIVLVGKGSWASVFSFLKALESLPHRVMINKTTLSKGESLWNTTIFLSLYMFN